MDQVNPIPGPQISTGPQPVRNQAAQMVGEGVKLHLHMVSVGSKLHAKPYTHPSLWKTMFLLKLVPGATENHV